VAWASVRECHPNGGARTAERFPAPGRAIAVCADRDWVGGVVARVAASRAAPPVASIWCERKDSIRRGVARGALRENG
jgi:hypothetical protein